MQPRNRYRLPTPLSQITSNQELRPLFLLIVYWSLAAVAAVSAFLAITRMQQETRGVSYIQDQRSSFPIGVNTALEQYSSDADLQHNLDLIRLSGMALVRQPFYWNEIEPAQGEYRWDKWDRVVNAAAANRLEIIAVLVTTPEWARDPGERDLLYAPPARFEDYARFAAAFAARYGDRVRYVQLWDNPNVHPNWGRRNADPAEYTAMLRAAAPAVRKARPGVRIISAGLAPNKELIREHPYYSDVLFLRDMYQAGARPYFDILAVKPYGMWTGPEDRRASPDVFNFSRAILLREEMISNGDKDKPVWGVEAGWNALPNDWEGKASPWGTDSEQVQGDRLVRAVQRARAEWNWMGALILQTWQPAAPYNDPIWGFALLDRESQPRALAAFARAAINAPAIPATFDFTRWYIALAALGLGMIVGGWRGAVMAGRVSWREGWHSLAARFLHLPELIQAAIIVAAVIALYYSRNVPLNFALLVLLAALFALRLDWGLNSIIFAIPFYLFPKNLVGAMEFSLVELLTLTAIAAWCFRQLVGHHKQASQNNKLTPDLARHRRLEEARGVLARLEPMDWAVILFAFAAVLSVAFAGNFGVANRELRVIVLEPILFYALIRAAQLTEKQLWRLANAFILSAVVISAIGLYQYLFTNYVIIGEGVRRVLAVYGSPNNLALFLERALPLLFALILFSPERRARIIYALAALPVTAAWYLTWSRGAWLGAGAGLLLVAAAGGRRVRLGLAALAVVAAISLIPFLGTPRAQSLFQTGTGTGFFRVSVWESAIAMIRDHPLVGVGLDNFLYQYSEYIKPEAWREPYLSHPHNIILDFWVRAGVGALVALFWMVFEFYTRGIRAWREGNALVLGLLGSMTAALFHGMIDAAYFYVDLAFSFMLLLGLIIQLTRKT